MTARPRLPQNTDRAHIARTVVRLLVLLNGRRTMPPMRFMAYHLSISTRTVRRYLDAIEQAGWPLPRRVHEDAA